METIYTKNAAQAGGHYSQAVAYDGLLFVSGQLPISSNGAHNFDKPFEKQVQVVLANLEAILKAGNSGRSKLLKVTVYLTDLINWGKFNELYAAFLGDYKPAKLVVPVTSLHYGYQLEIEAVAKIN